MHYRGSMQPALLRRFNACQQNEEDSAACQFLAKTIDERTFKARCFVRDRRRAFHEEQERILDAACECALDVLRSASTLRAQFNDSLRNKLSKRFDRGTLVINKDWSSRTRATAASARPPARPRRWMVRRRMVRRRMAQRNRRMTHCHCYMLRLHVTCEQPFNTISVIV